MFKKLTDKVASGAKNAVRNTAYRAENKAVSTVKQTVKNQFNAFVANVKKVNKKVNGPLIEDFNEFKTQWEAKAGDPEQSIFFFMIAAYQYAQGAKDNGEWMATVILPKTHLLPLDSSPTGFKINFQGDGFFLEQMAASPQIVNSYLGGTPDNNYTVDTKNLVMNIVSDGRTPTDATIHIQSAGKDFSSPCNLRKNNNGQWKLFTIGSIATGVQKTEAEKGDF
nr:hypothetical protein [Candidatus Sigynarchaeota archaeon]